MIDVKITILSVLLLMWSPIGSRADEYVKFVPKSVRVVVAPQGSKIANGKIAKAGVLHAKLGEKVLLFAVVRGKTNHGDVIVTSAPSTSKSGAGKLLRPESIHGLEFRWFKVQPIGNSYNNTAGGFHWDRIQYKEFPMGPWGASWSMEADAHPLPPYEDINDGAGTMAFMVRVRMGDVELSSPGKDSIFRGGLSDDVPRVTFRMDDSYIGRLTELFNTPYIWGSSGTSPEDHQSERLIGSDCADFIVYGARRLGKKIPYRATWHLPSVTRTISWGKSVDEKGQFLDAKGQPLKIGKKAIHIGDLLLFSGHVAALVKDEAPLGILDDNDIIIHTYWAPPRRQALKDTAYADSKVRILRWN